MLCDLYKFASVAEKEEQLQKDQTDQTQNVKRMKKIESPKSSADFETLLLTLLSYSDP